MHEEVYVDQVKREEEFRAAHPEWRLIAPTETRSILRGEEQWRAVGPRGDLVRGNELCDLLDQLEERVSTR